MKLALFSAMVVVLIWSSMSRAGGSGACCLLDGSCLILTSEECSNQGGDYQGDGTSCKPDTCPPGACCFSDGSCQILTPEECSATGDSYQGNGTVCDPNPCLPHPTGACCWPNAFCFVATEGLCLFEKGEYQGDGTDCTPNPCPGAPPLGACCDRYGFCSGETEDECAAHDDQRYWEEGVPCDPNPCVGACCNDGGGCEVTSAYECLKQPGHEYLGGATVCDPNPCVPHIGACCYGETGEQCLVVWRYDCLHNCGCEYQGDGSDCDPNPCEGDVGNLEVTSTPTGASILVDGVDTGYTTPHTFELAPGDYMVEWVKRGHRGCEDTYTVVANETTEAHCELLAHYVDLASMTVTSALSAIDLSPGHENQPVKLVFHTFTGNLTPSMIDTRFLFLNDVRLTDAIIPPNSPNGSVQGAIQVNIMSDMIGTAIGNLPPNAPNHQVVLDVWARLQSGRWVLSKVSIMVHLRGGMMAKLEETSMPSVVARPNPMRSMVSIEWRALDAVPTRLSIYDASGREIRELVSGSLGTGQHQYQWDGRDRAGGAVPSGVYYYRLLTGEKMVTEKIYLVR